MSIRRFIEQKLQKLSQNYKIVLLTGARQVGKSHLLTSLFPNAAHYVFDPHTDRWNARRDPDHFFQTLKFPIILDDIQYATEILPALQSVVKTTSKNGLVFLTGAPHIHVLKKMTDSLSDCMAVIELKGLTLFERTNQTDWLKKLLTQSQKLLLDFVGCVTVVDTVPELILRGNLPETARMPINVVRNYQAFCIKMYLENDIRLIDSAVDIDKFAQLMALLCGRTAQAVDLAELASALSLPSKTVQSWLDILTASYQWLLVPEFSADQSSMASPKHKGYFADTGLACHLSGITTTDALEQCSSFTYLFKSYCVNMIDALNQALQTPAKMSYFQGKNAASTVDVILESDGNYFPIEIIAKTKILREDAQGVVEFMEMHSDLKIPLALVLHMGTDCYFIAEKILAMPWNAVIQ